MNLEDEMHQAREELNYWIRREETGDSNLRQTQIQYFRNKIAGLEREIVERENATSIPRDYTLDVTQTMAILVGRQLTTNDIERVNRYVRDTVGSNLKVLTQIQYQLLAAEVIPDYKKYLYSTGIYSQYKVDGSGKIVS